MSLTFEKVDDILTEDARDTMTDKFTTDTDFVKTGVMELAVNPRKLRADEFDIIADIGKQLDDMWEVYAHLCYAYSTLLEKYQEATKETE